LNGVHRVPEANLYAWSNPTTLAPLSMAPTKTVPVPQHGSSNTSEGPTPSMERATAASGGSRAAAKLRGRFLKRCDRRTEGDLEWVETPRQIPWDVSRRASTAPPSPPLGLVSMAFAEGPSRFPSRGGAADCERFHRVDERVSRSHKKEETHKSENTWSRIPDKNMA
jgi:hypothetical protein